MVEAVRTYDPDRECPKCLNQEVRVQHVPPIHKRRDQDERRLSDEEHMERTCLRCGYQWDEKPLDFLESEESDDGE